MKNGSLIVARFVFGFIVLVTGLCGFGRSVSAGWLYTPPPRIFADGDSDKFEKAYKPSILIIGIVNNDTNTWIISTGDRVDKKRGKLTRREYSRLPDADRMVVQQWVVKPGSKLTLYLSPMNEEHSPVATLFAQRGPQGPTVSQSFQFWVQWGDGYYFTQTPEQRKVWTLPPRQGW